MTKADIETIVAQNIASYDEIVDEYHEKTKKLEKTEIRLRESFLSFISGKGIILDAGCGPGRDAKIFSEKGFDVMGIDLSKRMIGKARKIAPLAKFRIMDFSKLDFKKEKFDGIWFNAGLLKFPKKGAKKILCDMRLILKPNGIFFVSVKEGKGEGLKLDARYGVKKYYAYYGKKEFSDLLQLAGFKIIGTTRISLESEYHSHPWLNIFCKKAKKNFAGSLGSNK